MTRIMSDRPERPHRSHRRSTSRVLIAVLEGARDRAQAPRAMPVAEPHTVEGLDGRVRGRTVRAGDRVRTPRRRIATGRRVSSSSPATAPAEEIVRELSAAAALPYGLLPIDFGGAGWPTASSSHTWRRRLSNGPPPRADEHAHASRAPTRRMRCTAAAASAWPWTDLSTGRSRSTPAPDGRRHEGWSTDVDHEGSPDPLPGVRTAGRSRHHRERQPHASPALPAATA